MRQEQRIENKIDVVNSSFNFSVATENNLTFSGYSQTLIIEKEMIRGTSTREIKTDLQTMTLLQQTLRNFFLVEGLIVAPKPEEEIKTQPIEEVQTEETPS